MGALAGRRTPDGGRGALARRAVAFFAILVVVFAACGRVRPPAVSDREMSAAGSSALGDRVALASVDGFATQVGLDVLRAGGNAFDAAVAVGFALAVTHPLAGNLGGGGFMVVYLADEDRYTTIDFREEAPAAAHPEMFLDDSGEPIPEADSVGWRPVGVPGTVAGFARAHSQWGVLTWSRLVEPAVRLARHGFPVSPFLAEAFAEVADRFRDDPGASAAFLHDDGSPYLAGETLMQPDLAGSLEAIARNGPDAFYRGGIAEKVVAAMEANGGLITARDLEAYEALERPPVRGVYRGHEVVSMGPPSAGGVALIEMLNILEAFELSGMERDDPGVLHLMVEAMRQAYLDRARHLGDIDFVDVPVERLTSDAYGRRIAAELSTTRARDSAELGADLLRPRPESVHTTHYSIVDAAGNAVSLTYTIENWFGAKVVAPGTGFLLNNELGDFNVRPGVTDEEGAIGTEPNLAAPGKRPLSSMTPTIVGRQQDGRPMLLVGSPGGKTIINTVLRVVTGVVDFGLELPDAVAAPRLHHQWMPDRVFVEAGFSSEALESLRRMGHEVREARWQMGDAHCVYIYPDGVRLAVADRRRDGAAAAF